MKPVTATFGLASAAATLALFAGLVFTAAPAVAEDQPPQEFSFNFRYSPDELATTDGAQRVLDRLESSLRRNCREVGRFDAAQQRVIDQCVSSNLDLAVRQVGDPALASLADGRARS
jgi:UrcA family protein